MGEVHRLLVEHGKAKVLQMELDRSIVDAAAGYLSAEESEVGYLYSGWAQSALPHKRIPDDASWQIHTDHVSLVVQPGLKASKTGDAVSVGVPYGSRARLICLYLQSEAIRTNSREVELGRSLHAWLKKLDISIGGTSMKAVRDQAERISRCRISFEIKTGGRVGLVNQNIMDTAVFLQNDDHQGQLFIETAKLSEMFFEQLQKHPVPVQESAVKQISNNSMALDVYCWLAYRLHALKAPTPVSWKALQSQFGKTLPRMDQFRWYFKKTLAMAMAVYPDANVDDDGVRGLILKPSKPPVSPKIVSMAKRLQS